MVVIATLVVCVGATNIYNFMDGINGITAGYSLAVLLPLILVNAKIGFIDQSFLLVTLLAVLVFSIFNFRPKGKAKCFAGDVEHAYQIMANELRMSHPLVSCIYMLLQLAVSLGFIYLIPDTGTAHWIYLGSSLIILSIAYVLFMKKYYFLHEQYLASLKND